MQKTSALALAALLACSDIAAAQQAGKWQLGVGVGVIDTNYYRGAAQRRTYAAPFPYVRYHGARLHLDREGGRYYFVDSEKYKLDLNAAFSFPVKSDGETPRSGMEDLLPIFEFGPRLEIQLAHNPKSRSRLRLGFPLRAAIATDFTEAETAGAVFSPYLQYRFYTGWNNAIAVGPMWATEAYHDYFYQVDSQYATANRPAYNAEGGYSGTRITVSTTRRFDRYWFGLFARYDNLRNTEFEDSPLLQKDESLMVGAAFAYIFRRSSDRESVTETNRTSWFSSQPAPHGVDVRRLN